MDSDLMGKHAVVFTDGGFEVSGFIRKTDDRRLFIESNNRIFMIYKDKISIISVKLTSKSGESVSKITQRQDVSEVHDFRSEELPHDLNTEISDEPLPLDLDIFKKNMREAEDNPYYKKLNKLKSNSKYEDFSSYFRGSTSKQDNTGIEIKLADDSKKQNR